MSLGYNGGDCDGHHIRGNHGRNREHGVVAAAAAAGALIQVSEYQSMAAAEETSF